MTDTERLTAVGRSVVFPLVKGTRREDEPFVTRWRKHSTVLRMRGTIASSTPDQSCGGIMSVAETNPTRVVRACSGACSGFERHPVQAISLASPVVAHRSVRPTASLRHRHVTVPFSVSEAPRGGSEKRRPGKRAASNTVPAAHTGIGASQDSLEPRGIMEGFACAPSS